MRSVLTGVLAVMFGVAALWLGTNGFRAFTAEGARRLAVLETPRALPEVQLQDRRGITFGLDDLGGKLVLVNFIYTRCPDICSAMGDSFERIHDALAQPIREHEVVLLSISFDPHHDGPAELADYAERYDASDAAWRFARISDGRQMQDLLEAFGVVVIPDEFGGFAHNAAIHLVDRRGHLARIFDYDKPAAVLAELWARLRS
ncbi:MAG: SCO family protein [Alphaproteobacteria bacterium]|jgi:protein SCO1/2|nr:SCO family protein [Alphaproteobacteria bacterium]|tara:strand:+ start:2377 stop:2985 length:609 start_codon:yes stop_codon:yes gene_type:complete